MNSRQHHMLDCEKAMIRSLYQSKTDREIAEILGRTPSAVHKFRKREGLLREHVAVDAYGRPRTPAGTFAKTKNGTKPLMRQPRTFTMLPMQSLLSARWPA